MFPRKTATKTGRFHKFCSITVPRRYYLLTPWSRVLLEKLTGLQLVQKFPAFYGTRRFIDTLTSARHLSLSWASSNQSIPPHPIYWRSNLILSSHLRPGLPSGLFPSGRHYATFCTAKWLLYGTSCCDDDTQIDNNC